MGLYLEMGKSFAVLNENTCVQQLSILEYESVVTPLCCQHVASGACPKRFLWYLSLSVGLSKKIKSYNKKIEHCKITHLSRHRELLPLQDYLLYG